MILETQKESIAPRIKKYRLDRGWTVRQMAAVIGMSPGGLSMIELGRVRPHDLTIAKIERALPDLTLV